MTPFTMFPKPSPGSGRRERYIRKQQGKREAAKVSKRDRLERAKAMRKLREDAYQRDCGCCRVYGVSVRYEGTPLNQAELHHVVPRARGGGDVLSNVCIVSPEAHAKIHAGLVTVDGDPNGTLSLTERDLKGAIVRAWVSPNPSEGR